MKDSLEVLATSKRIDAGRDRAKEVVGAAGSRAQEALDTIDDAIDTIDIEPDAVRARLGRALAGVVSREVDCTREIEAAEDRMRLKTAVVTGIVACLLSAAVFLAAREIARRAEARRRSRRRAGRSLPPPAAGEAPSKPHGID